MKIYSSWSDISNKLSSEEALGGTLKKNLAIPEELKLIVDKETTASGKMEAVYDYVRNYFTWNGGESKFAGESLKKIYDAKTGTSGEINLVLVNFLQAFKLDAKPMLAAERSYGKVNQTYPLIDDFNKTVAYVIDRLQRAQRI